MLFDQVFLRVKRSAKPPNFLLHLAGQSPGKYRSILFNLRLRTVSLHFWIYIIFELRLPAIKMHFFFWVIFRAHFYRVSYQRPPILFKFNQ